ncbi:MAG: hypothetical protein GW947_04640 [Candidatus Pacebacteria bacterium]|nr:hypothetical protein [Candidatus Paceibacterota bacterium]PIR59970.1 MAG: hypothetical protein COU67_04275 [Candidatus Pacebacteria bacterium CG10_big_fil_rev_8_21_14_0_10_44_54]
MFGLDLTAILTQDSLLLLVFKFFFVVSALLYCLFAVVVIRQIVVMKNTLMTTFSPWLQIAGYTHLGLAIFVLLLFLVVL